MAIICNFADDMNQVENINCSFQTWEYPGTLRLERGGELCRPQIAFHTYGQLNPEADNVVWVCHALTANSEVAGWWPHTVENDCFLDPADKFVICANILGSCYGSTGPLSLNPATGQEYYTDFPRLTIRDIVGAHRLLAEHLGIGKIHSLVGSSVGGFQALEWAAEEPSRFGRIILIATDAKASPWAVAIDETQRMAILSDKSYGERRPDAARDGLAAARAIGLLTYRGPEGYNLSQQTPALPDHEIPDLLRACTYQQYQGEKLCRRFNAYSYLSILDSFDTHDIGRHRGGVANALAKIRAKTLVVGISTDIIFTPAEMKRLADMIPGARYVEIDSAFGHDGFLVEHHKLNQILIPFME